MAEHRLEPIVLIDKPNKKEAHVVANVHNTFGEIIEAAQKINTGLFEGDWSLAYLEPVTKRVVDVGEEDELLAYIDKEIYTYYWQYTKRSTFRDRKTKTNSKRNQPPPPPNSPYAHREQDGNQPPPRSKYQQRKQQAGKNTDQSIWLRMIAHFLDMLILGVLSMLGIRLFKNPAFGLIIWWLYQAVLESSDKQATIGKMAMGLKVMDSNGNKISFVRATARFFLKLLTVAILPLFLITFFNQKKQAIHDMVADTIVIEN